MISLNHLDLYVGSLWIECLHADILICRFGIYPLTCFELPEPIPSRQLASSPEVIDSVKSASPEPLESENRRIVNMMCNVKAREDGPGLLVLTDILSLIS